MNNSFGIYEKSFNLIVKTLFSFPEIEKAWIFGSRALGNYKKGSDIDIALEGKNINLDTLANLSGLLNDELEIPYELDLIDIKNCDNTDLLTHIKQKGILFLNRTELPPSIREPLD
ncbi:Nucleotidyltransferase domain [Phocoenobacter uteri]|uniref:Nucleotidyltransferase domain n=1 Tax=Phocoenobacter uteri TaxID=146806 RepID=A0A379CC57_9PAST|nr:nucleotidyltransferase domain-containing protein [Phocoenobacter uteri]MDG6881291.1 hypothetical protein [Phocoenobacter uteri]SUB59316.1 Nucleotidyltransferase domain [Phocoenobacter uteri]